MVVFIRNVQFLFFEYLEVKAQKISFFLKFDVYILGGV